MFRVMDLTGLRSRGTFEGGLCNAGANTNILRCVVLRGLESSITREL